MAFVQWMWRPDVDPFEAFAGGTLERDDHYEK